MAEKPILFSRPMVRAILDGRKTQTRRVVTPQPTSAEVAPHCENGWWMWRKWMKDQAGAPSIRLGDRLCPYGVPGDRLWVRETHAPRADCWGSWAKSVERKRNLMGDRELCYRATTDHRDWVEKWRPAIHMPRWACRIVLEVTDVRVQRLQEIDRTDAAAEGMCHAAERGEPFIQNHRFPEENFAFLWDVINGRGAWAANPWVWAVTFRRVS